MQATFSRHAECLESPRAVEVTQQLGGSGHLRLRNIRVEEDDEGRVILSGRVPTYYLKQVAQSIAVAVEGVGAICNELTVDSPVSPSRRR